MTDDLAIIRETVIRTEERLAAFVDVHATHRRDCETARDDHEKRLRAVEGRENIAAKMSVGAAAAAAAAAVAAWFKGHP